jgi:sensor histidine kinase YesM
MLEDHEKTAGLVNAVSEIMRYALEPANQKNILENEINALKAYIYIQGMRFDERMTISLNVNAGTLGVQTPPMILQPIVENAIIHGLSDMVVGGRIDIGVKKADRFIRVSVEDNGKGIDPQELAKIFNTESGPENPYQGKRPSIGLKNVIWKMKLFYERDDLVSVSSIPGKGTRVEILIPIPERMDDRKYSEAFLPDGNGGRSLV